MNFTFHWFRRDLRRHAPSLILWIVIVTVFTWARFWFRTHPQVTIPDRDLWLSIPAGALGFAEVCLLLGVMLDDPVRGSNALWKTRPPGGGAVFGAKVLIVVLMGIVIPLVAEAVFLALAGPSGGIATRTALFLMPPGLAVVAGVAALNWKGVLIWLPVVMAAVMAALGLTALFEYYHPGSVRYTDERLVAGAELSAATVCGFLACRRRCRQRLMAAGCVAAPMLVATMVACTGWPYDSLRNTPPPGADIRRIAVEWRDQTPYTKVTTYERLSWSRLDLPVRVSGLPEGYSLRGELLGAKVRTSDGETLILRRRQTDWFANERKAPGVWEASWGLEIDGNQTLRFAKGNFTAAGVFTFYCYQRQRHVLSLGDSHRITTGDATWTITPFVAPSTIKKDRPRLWCRWEYIDAGQRSYRGHSWMDEGSGTLVRKSTGTVLKVEQISFYPWANLWEGIGRGEEGLGFWIADAGGPERLKEWHDSAYSGGWQLEFDTLSLAGTLYVPFELHWSAGR